MSKYRVEAHETIGYYAIVEAESAEEAMVLAQRAREKNGTEDFSDSGYFEGLELDGVELYDGDIEPFFSIEEYPNE